MKRYVKEFASDMLKRDLTEQQKTEIVHIVKLAHSYMITDYEAIRSIVQTIEKE